MITLDIQKQLGDFSLDIQAEIPSFGICAVFGRSGSGKTSLLDVLSGLSCPDQGRIQIGDTVTYDGALNINIPTERRKIGYVFQDARLFPHLTVLKNLRYGFKPERKSAYWDTSNILDQIIHLLDLQGLLKRYPFQLSGGEKQRVAIGRALLTCPDILLMDEPTAALDLPRKQEIIHYLLTLVSRIQIPILYVTHHLDEIAQLADHMLLIDKGRIIANGTTQAVWHSEHLRPWFNQHNLSALMTASIVEHRIDHQLTKVRLSKQYIWIPLIHVPVDHLIRLRLFARDISLTKQPSEDSSIRNILTVTITQIESTSNRGESLISLELDDQVGFALITSWAVNELAFAVGDTLYAQIKSVCIAKGDINIQI